MMEPSSSLKVTHRSFRHASPHLWNQLPTSLRIPHPNYSSHSQRPSFDHAGLSCYTLLSLITISLWAQNLPVQKILFSTLVCFCLSDRSHGCRPFTGLICYRLYVFSSIFFCFSYSYVWQTKLASSLVNFWEQYKIVWLIDFYRKKGKKVIKRSLHIHNEGWTENRG